MRIITSCLLNISLTLLPFSGFLYAEGGDLATGAKEPKSATKSKHAHAQHTGSAQPDINARFATLVGVYQRGKLSKSDFWQKLASYEGASGNKLSPTNKINLAQWQSKLLKQAGYPVLAAFYASAAIKGANNPFDPVLESSWQVMEETASGNPIQYVLEDLAVENDIKDKNPPIFGNDWNFVRGNAIADSSPKQAIEYYRRLDQKDRYYLPGQYQIAILSIENKQPEQAEEALGRIIDRRTLNDAVVSAADKQKMLNYANIALGRFYYEQKEFLKSVRHYRQVPKDSPLFYEALFEQSWALFMSGNPGHALGSLHGAQSPFFAEKFNPEAKLLEAMIYYWLCRYDDANYALMQFNSDNTTSIDALREYLSKKRIDSNTAYQLFEDLVSGVSSESLSIPRRVLATAAEKDTMLLLRDQLATIIVEEETLKAKGVFATRKATLSQAKMLSNTKNRLRRTLGEQFIVELKSIKKDFDGMSEQSQFLALELLMSKKEQLMGGELHSSTKVVKVSDKVNIDGWVKDKQSWIDNKGEFWWDEIGYQIIEVKPQCNVQ